jgi:hypothetical protein
LPRLRLLWSGGVAGLQLWESDNFIYRAIGVHFLDDDLPDPE